MAQRSLRKLFFAFLGDSFRVLCVKSVVDYFIEFLSNRAVASLTEE